MNQVTINIKIDPNQLLQAIQDSKNTVEVIPATVEVIKLMPGKEAVVIKAPDPEQLVHKSKYYSPRKKLPEKECLYCKTIFNSGPCYWDGCCSIKCLSRYNSL